MKTGLTRRLWLSFAALAFFTCPAIARPLLIPPQNLAVPPLPGAPDNPDIVTQYGALGIDQGTLLVAAYRPRDAEGNYESAVHIFERNTQGSWIYAGILTVQPLIGDLRIGGTVAAVSTVRTPDTPSAITIFERGATGWALTGTFPATNSRLVRVEDGSLYLEPQDGCTSPYQEFRKVNGTWTQVATIGGQRCDRNQPDINDGRAVITHRPVDSSTPEPAEVFASSRPAWNPIGSISPPDRTPFSIWGYGGTIRGDTIYINGGYLYRNSGGAWMSAGRLLEPEAELSIGSSQGKLRGNHLFLHGAERDYERPDYYEDSYYEWNVLRVYRQNTAGAFVYHARLNADYSVTHWAVSDDGRQVAAAGYHVNNRGYEEVRRLYVFEIPETASFPGTRQDTFSAGNYSRWTVAAGQFAVVQSGASRVLRQSDLTGTASAYLTDIDWTDQAIEADMRPLEFASAGRSFGLVTRRSDAQNYYYATVRSPGVISLLRMRDGVYTQLGTAGIEDFQVGHNYRIRFESVGDQHAVFIDGFQKLRVRDKTLSHGHPGIASYRTRFEVDNVVVSGGTRVLLRQDDLYGGFLSDGWQSAIGGWEMPYGQTYGSYLMQTDNEASARWFSTVAVGYQVVSARVRPQSYGTSGEPWIGLAARVIDSSNYYYMTLRSSQQLSLRRKVNGQIQVLATVPQSVNLGTIYDLRLEIIGTHIRAYVNGELKIEKLDSTLSEGGGGRNGLLMNKTAADVLSYVAYQP
jgi:hypothetical protein